MEPQAAMPPVMGSQTKWAKPEDWNRYKNTITALFTCHSLSNVMRIMREDHDFHATAKMYNVHIYQKWGIRKGRPESSKKKKRRREPTEEPESAESVATSSYRTSDGTEEELSNPEQHHAGPLTITSGPLPVGSYLPPAAFGDLEPHQQQQLLEIQALKAYAPPPPEAPLRVPPPPAWERFLQTSQPALSTQPFNANVPPPNMAAAHPYGQYVHGHNNSNMQNLPWMTTVLAPTPPSPGTTTTLSWQDSSVRSYTSRSSGRSQSSKTSARSRTSAASSSRETLLSDASQKKNSGAKRRYTKSPTMEIPYGSIRWLGPPDSLLFAERSMWFARHYISSSFSTGLWSLSQNSDTSLLDTECVRLDRWYNNFGPGLDLLHSGQIAKAFEIFMRCFAATEQIIEPQDPRVVIYICQQAIRLMWYDNHGRKLAQTLLKYVSALCKKLFSDRHPLFIIMDQLGRMDNFQFAKSIPALMECYFDHLEPFLEQSSTAFRFLNDLRGLTISIMEGTQMIGMYEAMPLLEGLVKRAEDRGHPALHVRLEMAAMLNRGRFFDEAVALLNELCKDPATRADPYEYTYANLILMLTYRKMKDSESVIKVGYGMVEYLQVPPPALAEGDKDFANELWAANYRPCTAIIWGKLEMELREVGRPEEADQVKARLDIIMDEEYGINQDTQQGSEKDLEEGVAAFGREQAR